MGSRVAQKSPLGYPWTQCMSETITFRLAADQMHNAKHNNRPKNPKRGATGKESKLQDENSSFPLLHNIMRLVVQAFAMYASFPDMSFQLSKIMM